ncbi:MAG: DUF4190 domain-containing protein [Bacteroidales bacterium]|nr:DUF4190 domain-containing protein [Bacteroidales bacterium]
MKKQSSIYIFLLIVIIVGLNSCTIKKRSYQPGYYVDWHNTNKKVKSNPEISQLNLPETIVEEKSETQDNNNITKHNIQSSENPEAELIFASSEENNIDMITTSSTNQQNAIFFNSNNNNYEINESEATIEEDFHIIKSDNEKDMHWTTIVGFSLNILAVFAFFLIWFGSLPIAIAGLIFSGIALEKNKSNPEKYRGKGLNIASLIIGSIVLLLGMLSLFMYLFFLVTFFV